MKKYSENKLDNYWKNRLAIKSLFLNDAMHFVAEYATVLEGHEEAEDYRVSISSHWNKLKDFIEKAVNDQSFSGEIVWDECNQDNWNPQIDFYKSKVELTPFLTWCAGKKIQIPSLLLDREIDNPPEGADDKDLSKKVLAAIHSGVICREQGTEIKKEDLYNKVNQLVKISGPKFECVWKLIPEDYKLSQGNPGTIVDRAIKGGVIAGISLNTLDCKNFPKSVKKLLTSHGIEKIDAGYFDVIVDVVTEWAEKTGKPS
jgi:hypothetical protein